LGLDWIPPAKASVTFIHAYSDKPSDGFPMKNLFGFNFLNAVYGVSLAIWDHTMLLATRHNLINPALNQPQPVRLVPDLSTPEGWKAELT